MNEETMNEEIMTKEFFVTGTDTGVGKTRIACSLLNAAKQHGLTTAGFKPVASGCKKIEGTWQNEDALALQQHSSVDIEYETINPIALPEAIAPHVAARLNQTDLTCRTLINHYRSFSGVPAQFKIIEGAGGWFVPLNDSETLADFVEQLSLPIILVVGIRLGCINHALLSEYAILARNLCLTGWVANCMESKTDMMDETIETLQQRISAPCLGVMPFSKELSMTNNLDIQALINA